MRTIGEKLRQMKRSESKNLGNIAMYGDYSQRTEYKRSRLAWIEGYTTERPGYEGMREQIIRRYRAELNIQQEGIDGI